MIWVPACAGMLSDFRYNATAFLEHGLVGGVFSVVGGHGFGSGFLAGGVSELATPYIENPQTGDIALGTTESAVVGGVSSVLGGGKFGNGAVTGSFSYLFNHVGHLLAGQDAHNVLLRYLEGQPQNGSYWSGNNTFGGLFGSGRPDLIFSLTDPLSIYEIKPLGSDAAAEAQLSQYLLSAGGAAMAGDNRFIFGGASSLTLNSDWFFGRTTYTYFPGQNGVITYAVDNTNVFQEIWRAYTSRPNGGSLVPFPLSPFLAIP